MSAPVNQAEASIAPISEPFNFNAFPPELRAKVLAENLIVDDGDTGLVVQNGSIKPLTELTSSLLDKSNPQLRSEALEVLLSRNRIVLDGDFEESLAWLREQGDAIRKIRDLDIQFGIDEIEEFAKPGSGWPAKWDALIEFIGENLTLRNLTLSLDHGTAYEYYEQRFQEEENMGKVRAAYEEIARGRPLRALGENGLKAFYVFWVAFYKMEGVVERAVMGEGYQPPGKVPHTIRDPDYPHGAV
jgi:hypothetical protein